jgi:opacity protein-like surface antigen
MGTFKTLRLSGGLALACASPALAADMLFPPGMVPGGRPGIVEIGTGWYLRGDVGYVDYDKINGSHRRDIAFAEAEPERTWSAGGGFGYKFTSLLRADVTVDYRFESDFESVSSRTGFVADSRREWGKFDSTSILLNGYIDLGDWSGFTPYVGAGIGAAFNSLHEFSTQVTCLTAACGPLGAQAIVALDSRRTTDLAWALMAGVAVELGGGFKLDAGYRYVNLGEAEMRFAPGAAAVRTEDQDAHELRVGLRYMVD